MQTFGKTGHKTCFRHLMDFLNYTKGGRGNQNLATRIEGGKSGQKQIILPSTVTLLTVIL